MTEILPFLFIGTTGEVNSLTDFRVVNLAHTYHYELHEWKLRDKIDRSKDQCYILCKETPWLLSVNWVDAHEAKYFDYNGFGVQVMHEIFDFIDRARMQKKNVIVVCNKGQSRSPSVVMSYVAKRTQELDIRLPEGGMFSGIETIPPNYEPKKIRLEKPPYGWAREQFTKRFYPDYAPGQGITQFLIDKWDQL